MCKQDSNRRSGLWVRGAERAENYFPLVGLQWTLILTDRGIRTVEYPRLSTSTLFHLPAAYERRVRGQVISMPRTVRGFKRRFACHRFPDPMGRRKGDTHEFSPARTGSKNLSPKATHRRLATPGRSGTGGVRTTLYGDGRPCPIDVSRLVSGPPLEIRACICLSVSTIQIPFSGLSLEP